MLRPNGHLSAIPTLRVCNVHAYSHMHIVLTHLLYTVLRVLHFRAFHLAIACIDIAQHLVIVSKRYHRCVLYMDCLV